MLQFGSRDALRVRRETPGCTDGLRLLYASDLHWTRRTAHVVDQLHQACRKTAPDVLLLGGDLVDLLNGLPLLGEFTQAQTCPVYAVGGNHDVLVGLKAVQNCVTEAGGHWLDERVQLTPRLALDGRLQPISETPTILCAHDPAVFPAAVDAGYALVLAGHLHGGQGVALERDGRLYPGALFYRWNGDRFHCGDTTMLVSRGVHDTLPVRWNCPREVILCC